MRDSTSLTVLAFEPYYGGSHQAFLDGWHKHSRHSFTVLTLPAHHWKWRMRHAAVTLASRLKDQSPEWLEQVDIIWTSSMLNAAELRGLLPIELKNTPIVCYFHENQLSYPTRREDERDHHFAFTHLLSALASDAVWFNSDYNRRILLDGLDALLKRMPDRRERQSVVAIEQKSRVLHPGIDPPDAQQAHARDTTGPLRIAWAARWEHDKGPEVLFEGLRRLKAHGTEFRVSILGEQFKTAPEAFETAQLEFKEHIDEFGYLPNRAAYYRTLNAADVFVSTARHEFFGLAVMEAALRGCRPLLPRALVYPELFGDLPVFYDGSGRELAECLAQPDIREEVPMARAIAEAVVWERQACRLDNALAEVARQNSI